MMYRNVKWDSRTMQKYVRDIVYIYARVKLAFSSTQILEDNLDNAELLKQLEKIQMKLSDMRKSVRSYMAEAGMRK